MAKKKANKIASQPKKQPRREVEELDDSDEELPDILSLNNNNKKNHYDEEDDEEEEVFDLGEDEDEDEEEEEEEEGDEVDDDFEEDEEDDNDLNNLIKNLPASLRQKVISKNPNIEDDSDDEEEDNDQQNELSWGKKKNYWSADTTDLEIGQDVQDAEDEEEAALELQKQRLEKVNKSDYYDDNEDEEEEEEEDGKDEEERFTNKTKDLLSKKLSMIANDKEIEFIKKDFSKLSKEEKLDLISTESPELLLLLEDLKEKIDILQTKINPLRNLLEKFAAASSSSSALITDDLVQYLEVKQQILLSYCINMLFYLMLKSQGSSVKSHPVMRQLLELRYAMEKLRPLDGKLKHQIDRLLRYIPNDTSTTTDTMTLRPNPFDLLARDGEDDNEDDVNNTYYDNNDMTTATNKSKSGSSGIYKAPKLQAMPYKDNEDELDKQKEKLDRKKKKLKNTEILQTLQEEFGHKPEMTSSSGVSISSKELKQLEEEENERKTFEEDRFVRLTLSKKDKKSIKKRLREASTLEGLGVTDIGDINEFEDFANLARSVEDGNARLSRRKDKNNQTMTNEEDRLDGGDSTSNATALQRAVNAFALSASSNNNKNNENSFNDDYDMTESSNNKKNKKDSKSSMKRKGEINDEEDENDFDNILNEYSQKKQKPSRRPAPDSSFDNGFGVEYQDDEGDDGEDLVALVSKQKKAFAELKKDHYTPAPKYGSVEEDSRFNNIQGDEKRAASYEIIANRGLTPHRKKDTKNPRVKKRKAFEKASQARKGQVQDVIVGAAGSYGGEQTGIKANISKSRKITN